MVYVPYIRSRIPPRVAASPVRRATSTRPSRAVVGRVEVAVEVEVEVARRTGVVVGVIPRTSFASWRPLRCASTRAIASASMWIF